MSKILLLLALTRKSKIWETLAQLIKLNKSIPLLQYKKFPGLPVEQTLRSPRPFFKDLIFFNSFFFLIVFAEKKVFLFT